MPADNTGTSAPVGQAAFKKAYDDGQTEANKLFADGSMGRMGSTAEAADVMARRKAMLDGMNSQEMQAQRELADGEINRNAQTSLRQMRGIQGAAGVRGATAGAQQANILNMAGRNKQDFERQLLLDNMAAKRAGLDAYENSVNGRDQFNIGQQNKEQYGRSAFPFQYAGMQQGFITDANNARLTQQQLDDADAYNKGILGIESRRVGAQEMQAKAAANNPFSETPVTPTQANDQGVQVDANGNTPGYNPYPNSGPYAKVGGSGASTGSPRQKER